MKVLVLTTGRTGSMSLYRACQHIKNYTTGHDSKAGLLAAERTMVADQHIEIDTRFAWMLGRLALLDKGDVHYVHLTRATEDIAQSYNLRWANRKGIMRGYCEGILERDKAPGDLAIARDLVETTEDNIKAFLVGRPHSTLRLETIGNDLAALFDKIRADVQAEDAMAEFRKRHNHSRRLSLFMRSRLWLSLYFDALERALMRLRGRP